MVQTAGKILGINEQKRYRGIFVSTLEDTPCALLTAAALAESVQDRKGQVAAFMRRMGVENIETMTAADGPTISAGGRCTLGPNLFVGNSTPSINDTRMKATTSVSFYFEYAIDSHAILLFIKCVKGVVAFVVSE